MNHLKHDFPPKTHNRSCSAETADRISKQPDRDAARDEETTKQANEEAQLPGDPPHPRGRDVPRLRARHGPLVRHQVSPASGKDQPYLEIEKGASGQSFSRSRRGSGPAQRNATFLHQPAPPRGPLRTPPARGRHRPHHSPHGDGQDGRAAGPGHLRRSPRARDRARLRSRNRAQGAAAATATPVAAPRGGRLPLPADDISKRARHRRLHLHIVDHREADRYRRKRRFGDGRLRRKCPPEVERRLGGEERNGGNRGRTRGFYPTVPRRKGPDRGEGEHGQDYPQR